MIKIGGVRVSAAAAAKDLILGEVDGFTRSFIYNQLDTKDSAITEKEAKEVFEWIERYRLKLADEWGYDTVEREYR